ncbi:hypothetical protein MHBO_003295 [Bonamia ostreae]|uniref:Uncharacterized protein n=1 Tax=Bonamia ostreae TaxID=126728 RepID=A0ABV2AQK1_9EUKA
MKIQLIWFDLTGMMYTFCLLKVFLPTGTSVKISIYESREWLTSTTSTTLWYINVEIYPTIADTNSTSGLCGFQDNNQTNDLRWKDGTESDISLYDYFKTHPNDFAKSWGYVI